MAATAHTFSTRRGGPPPRLRINSNLSNSNLSTLSSPDSSILSSSRPSLATSTTAETVTPNSSSEPFFVLCLYDYNAEDHDQLTFRRDEILDVVKREDSGWWAAVREDDNRVGWIPSAFVEPISDAKAERLRGGNVNVQVYDQDAARNHGSPEGFTDPFAPTPDDQRRAYDWMPLGNGDKVPIVQHTSVPGLMDPLSTILSPIAPPHEGIDGNFLSEGELSPIDRIASRARSRPFYPGEDAMPTTPPPPITDSPVPITPRTAALRRSRSSSLPTLDTSVGEHQRSRSESAKPPLRHLRRRPLIIDDQSSLNRLTTLLETQNSAELDQLIMSPVALDSPDAWARSPRNIVARPDKIRQITGDDEARDFHDKQTIWFLRPMYGDEIELNFDGSVRAGTLRSLVERLTVDVPKSDRAVQFRKVFLTTYKSFTTANKIFDMLTLQFNVTHPPSLNAKEVEQWREKKVKPTRQRILDLLLVWCEDFGMLQDDPLLARRVVDFLSSIATMAALAGTARQVLKSLEKFISVVPTTPSSALRRKKSKGPKTDLTRLDALLVAEHLCMLQHRIYAKIRPQDCINWLKSQTGSGVKHINALHNANDKLSTWVKLSVLSTEGMGKRADTIDFWIKVAEKCNLLHNYGALHAIVSALSSTLVTRIHLTWAYVSRRIQFDPMVKYEENDFEAYRLFQRTAGGPCIPLVRMYLADMSRVDEAYPDTLDTLSPTSPSLSMGPAGGTPGPYINFAKREMWYEPMDAILRHQKKLYTFAEDPTITAFIDSNLATASGHDQTSLWMKSQEIQQAERSHMDIRKGLELAGF